MGATANAPVAASGLGAAACALLMSWVILRSRLRFAWVLDVIPMSRSACRI